MLFKPLAKLAVGIALGTSILFGVPNTTNAQDVWVFTYRDIEYYVDDQSLVYDSKNITWTVGYTMVMDIGGKNATLYQHMMFYRDKDDYARCRIIEEPEMDQYVYADHFTGALFEWILEHNGNEII